MKKIMAWHFCQVDKNGNPILRNGEKAQRVGGVERYKGPLVMCESGLHASVNIIDALSFSPGPFLRRVECGGEREIGDDKLICTKRTIAAEANMDRQMHEFACLCAERALTVAAVTNKSCWDAIEAKRKWLRNEIGDEELSAAWASAWAFSRASSAWASARSFARASSSWASAWAFARDAARASAWASDRAFARADEKQWQAEQLEKMFWEVAGEK